MVLEVLGQLRSQQGADKSTALEINQMEISALLVDEEGPQQGDRGDEESDGARRADEPALWTTESH